MSWPRAPPRWACLHVQCTGLSSAFSVAIILLRLALRILNLRLKSSIVRGDVHTNIAENWFSLLKRGVTGTFRHVSEQHLDRYVGEFQFRFNNRHVDDGERTIKALRSTEGKRLMYKDTKEEA